MIIVLLAEGFEEIEALTPVDMMRRAGLEVKTVGIGGKTVVGAHGIAVVADATPDEIADPEAYVCCHLVVLDAHESDAGHLKTVFGGLNAVHFTEGRFSFITDEMSEAEVKAGIAAVGYPLVTRIRVL
jgi:hypothetical protein